MSSRYPYLQYWWIATSASAVLQRVAVCCSVWQCVWHHVSVCCSVLQCLTECCSVLQCVAVCCSVLQCVPVDEACMVDAETRWISSNTMLACPYSSIATSAIHCNTVQHPATHCNIVQHTCDGAWRDCCEIDTRCHVSNTLQHTATCCNTLQHSAAHCNSPQHTATRLQCMTWLMRCRYPSIFINCHVSNTQQHTIIHYNALQCTATHCNALQLTATQCNSPVDGAWRG